MRLFVPLLLTGCMTATNLAEEFVEPLEERLGDPASPATGTIEARLAELEAQVAASDVTALEQRITDLESDNEDLLSRVTNAEAQISDLWDALGGASSVELWGIGERANARVFNPDGSTGRIWTFPLDGDTPAVVRLESPDCRAVLLSVSMSNMRDTGDRVGLSLGVDPNLETPVRAGMISRVAEPSTRSLTAQVWVPTGGADRIRVRTAPAVDIPTSAIIHHIGCIK